MIVDCSVYRGGLRTAGPSDLVGALDLARSSDGGFVWIGLYKPTVEEFALVRRGFGLHPLAVEDALEAHQRPKLEVYDDSLFVVLKPVVYEPGKDTASRIYTFKRQIQEFRRATGPLAMPLIRLAAMGSAGGPGPGSGGPGPLPLALPTVDEAIKPFFRDVSDHVTRVNESVDSLDRLVSDALSAYLAQVGVRQNDDMRKISARAAMLTVPTLLAGVYGMNVDNMPELHWHYAYYGLLAVMVVLEVILYRVFKRRGWL